MRITLKLATSLDGKIATASGESRWITGPQARAEVHRLRALHMAVLVGVDTVITDDPDLTVRLDGFAGPQPQRIVLDSRLRVPLDARLVTTARSTPTIVVSTMDSNKRLTDAGVSVLKVASLEGRVDPAAAVAALKAKGVAAMLIEGGGQVAASFVAAGLVDAIEWFRAPIILGEEGKAAIGVFPLKSLSSAPAFRRLAVESRGNDLWERYVRQDS